MNGDWTETRTAPAANADHAVRSHVTWNLVDLVAGIVGALILIFVLATLAQVLVGQRYGDEAPETYFASFVATIAWDAGFVAFVLWLVARRGGGLRNLGFRSSAVTLSGLSGWIVASYIGLFATVAVYNIIIELLGLDFLVPSRQLPENMFASTAVVLIGGVAIVLAAPVAEEIFFRGFLFAGLTRYLPVVPSAVVSGAIFSLAHANLGLVLPFTLIGAVLALLYARTNSLLAPIVVHLMFNLTSYTILVFVPNAR